MGQAVEMKKRTKLQGQQLLIPGLDEITTRDRVTCPLGENLGVYYVSDSCIWVILPNGTTARPVERQSCSKVNGQEG
jgi:hypothetical protein